MRATTLIGSILLLPGLGASPLAAQDGPAHRVERVTVEHAGARVFVHITADGVASSLGTPEPLGDATRLTLTLRETTLGSPVPVRSLQDPSLLDAHLDQRGDDVVLTIDAASMADYGLEPRDGGVVLWFEPAPEPDPVPTPEALAQEALAALAFANTAQPAADAADAVPGDGADGDAGRTLRAGPSDFLVDIAAGAGRLLSALPVDRGTLAIAIPGSTVALILLAMTWWLFRRRNRREPEPAAATVSTGEAFAWAARMLRNEGLDVGGIARRTGIARDAVVLLLETMDPANPAAPGIPFRPTGPAAVAGKRAPESVSH